MIRLWLDVSSDFLAIGRQHVKMAISLHSVENTLVSMDMTFPVGALTEGI